MSVRDQIAGIADDTEHGASYLTSRALEALGVAAGEIPPSLGWVREISQVAERLAAAKPAMAGLRNATFLLLKRLLVIGPDEAMRNAVPIVEEFRSRLEGAAVTSAGNAAGLLSQRAGILTCSYSSSLIRVCRMSRQQGKRVSVRVFESADTTGSHGCRLRDALIAEGVQARLVGLAELRSDMRTVQLVLTGADAVTHACIMNGIPSLALAEAAKGIAPVYVVCETIKFALSAREAEGFDRVPSSLVTGIATELGVLSVSEIESHIPVIDVHSD